MSDDDTGQLLFLDPTTHEVVAWEELYLTRADAEIALERTPDFESDRVVSWGRIDLEQAQRLAIGERAVDLIDERLDDLAALFAIHERMLVSFHYADPYRVE